MSTDPLQGMTQDCIDWLEDQEKEFMVPRAVLFTHDEVNEWESRGGFEDEEECEDDDLSGWYSRLTAPGFFDCTDWDGPHATEQKALVALYEMYAD